MKALWDVYWTTRSIADRNRLMEHYRGYVVTIAIKTKKRLPRCVQLDDLIQDGWMVLAELIPRFDPSRGVTFTEYAHHRIAGAMLDGLRRMDWVPRAVRNTDERPAMMLSLPRRVEAIEARDGQRGECYGFERLLAKLPERQQQVLRLYYEGDMNTRAVSELMGITKQSVQNLRAKAFRKLKRIGGITTKRVYRADTLNE